MLFHPTGTLPARMACFGATGTGAQFALDLRHQAGGAPEFLGYVDDLRDDRRRPEKGYPVLSFEELLAQDDVGVFVSVHDPAGRRRIVDRLRDRGVPVLGANGSPHLCHPDAVLGEGAIVSSTTRVGHTAEIGCGVLVLASLVAHDVEIGDFCTLAFGSMVLGHVRLGDGVFVGAGAIIQNGTPDRTLTVGDGAVIGAGAVVTADVAPGEVMVGPRALPLQQWRTLLAGDGSDR